MEGITLGARSVTATGIEPATPRETVLTTPRTIVHCAGESYRPQTRRPSIYCSRACKEDARRIRLAAERLETNLERQCLHCAAVIPRSARKRKDVIFCSAECNSRAHALQRKLRARRGEDGKPGYLRAAICERDKWRCWLCDRFVDRWAEHPDPLCPSLDHMVPVSHGGGNELSNLRLTHLVCNLRRRNLPSELVKKEKVLTK